MSRQTLEQLLVQTQLLAPVQLAIAQREAQTRQKRLAGAVIDLGLVGDRPFAEWMAKNSGAPLLHPIPEGEVDKLQRRLPRAIAREYEAVPVALDRDELTVAVLNPLDADALQVLRTATGLKIRPAVGVYSELRRLLAKFYPEDDIESTMLPSANVTMGPPSGGAGSQTIALPPTAPAESQLDRIERHLQWLHSRIEAMESLLRRVLPPQK